MSSGSLLEGRSHHVASVSRSQAGRPHSANMGSLREAQTQAQKVLAGPGSSRVRTKG